MTNILNTEIGLALYEKLSKQNEGIPEYDCVTISTFQKWIEEMVIKQLTCYPHKYREGNKMRPKCAKCGMLLEDAGKYKLTY